MTGARRGRHVGIGLAVLALTMLTALAAPSSAQAHAVLVGTVPAPGAVLPAVPAEVVLTFDVPPIGLGSSVRVSTAAGSVSVGSARVIDAGVHQAVRPDAGSGRYTVRWRVVSEDGHPVSGSFDFTVASSGGAATQSRPPATDGPGSTRSAAGAPSVAHRPSAIHPATGVPSGWVALGLAALAMVGAVVVTARRRRAG